MLKQVEIFTDGSCLGNPGPGGYGAILRYRGREKTFSAGYTRTTNNRMELMAAIVAHQIKWEWVKGHAGHPENERCDELARAAAMNPTLEDTGYQVEV